MLYIVATPIGNLADITLRALDVLKSVSIILCEDTRVTRKLLEHYEIRGKKLISYHQHTNEKKVKELVKLIKNNNAALVTDAGTPGISDPGGQLIAEITKDQKNQKWVVPIPGVSALTAALSISGVPTDEFLFKGFVPHKRKRQKFLKEVLSSKQTVIFFESPHRIIKCLEQLYQLDSSKLKRFIVCRELTKKFETIYRGDALEVLDAVRNDAVKGEYVIVAS